MKLDTFLFIFTLILAFAAGNISYFVRSQKVADLNDIKEIQMLNFELQEDRIPYIRIDLNSEYPSKDYLPLLVGETAINHINQVMFFNSDDCLKVKKTRWRPTQINKENIWIRYQCDFLEALPINFFTTPPFMHSNGLSYAYMYLNSIPSRNQQRKWMQKYARFMHIEELKKHRAFLNHHQRFLMALSSGVLKKIIQGDKSILTNYFYFIKTGNLKYFVIENAKVKKHFARAGYEISQSQGKCFLKIGNVCWNQKPHNLVSFLSQTSIIFFMGTLGVFFLTARILYTRVKKQKVQEERKKHALRVLTHELRTPVASLLLQINNLNRSSRMLPPEAQEDILRLESDIYRLKHLAEKSQSYLQTDSSDIVHLTPVEISSMKEFTEDLLFEYPDTQLDIKVAQDYSLEIDSYWLKMCVTNLIENAIRYGVAPIEIIIDTTNKHKTITVKDQGNPPFKTLKELLKNRNENSKGLGLGLNIVNKTLKAMGGELCLETGPTQFIIKFKHEGKK